VWLKPLIRVDGLRVFRDTAGREYPDDTYMDLLLDRTAGIPLAIFLVARFAAPYPSLTGVRQAWTNLGLPGIAVADGQLGKQKGVLAACIPLSLSSPRLDDSGCRLFALLGQLPAGLASADTLAMLATQAALGERQLRVVGLLKERDERLDLLPPIRKVACLPSHAPPAVRPGGNRAPAGWRPAVTAPRCLRAAAAGLRRKGKKRRVWREACGGP
jgi:hypothetical protein